MLKVKRGSGAPDLANHDTDMRLRSITPTTHLQRDLYQDGTDLNSGSLASSPINDAIFYQDVYKHKTWAAEIVSFGINSYNVTIRAELVRHNALQATKIATLGAMSNASNATNYPQFVKEIIPTQYEQELMDCAIKYFVDQKKKVVLVDTFPRALKADSKSKLKLGDIEIPSPIEPLATHTVILYKNSRGDILVIDPNNPKFSGHLQHIKVIGQQNFLVSNSPSDMHKIYAPKPNTKTGPTKDLYRDCVDLAVKLAALLDIDPVDYQSVDQVMQSNAVFLISNREPITKFPKRIVEDLPLRIKQVSHLGKLEVINNDLLKYANSLDKKEMEATLKLKAAEKAAKASFEMEIADARTTLELEVSNLLGHCANDPDLGGSYA